MTTNGEIDLKAAVNAISDVITNRPRPLREFDQIHMKAGDMVMQAEFVARWAAGKRLVFIGDGDAISVCVAYLCERGIFPYGPTQILVLDFDERVIGAVKRFADKERIPTLDATLYNCIDELPPLSDFDAFYTNPPWGASNGGTSVHLFAYRGMQATNFAGEGLVVIADDEELDWAQAVLGATQRFASDQGFYVKRMTPQLHAYHLDDAPDLLSCNLVFRALPRSARPESQPLVVDAALLENFYGAGKAPRVHYVRELKRLDYGKAHQDEYRLELLDG
ncbi:bis-aminopropyl spermidine synthase family protein [Cellulomonas sp. NS3]|uniref:bis-aminopropyl spermidine synthase family protein n=1 Tax=Cellulomonas sp. NS3 TaxID=2973977 RepID=UPI002163F9AB|nr:bis-aminopropyl spermidine synthase family protein [Cellulomonas sp. NS3]